MNAQQTGKIQRKGRSGVVVPHMPPWYQRLAAWIVVSIVKAVCLTLRYRWHDNSGHFEPGFPRGPVIYTVWHNRLGLSMQAYLYTKKRRGSIGMAAMVSASKDGGFLAAILEGFRVQPVRGSSSRRGPQALLETPKVVVGTVHSVKGGQADVVYLFPDLSQAGDAQYARGGVASDSVIRQFYVGVTRAREKLYICQAESGMRISI